MNILLYGGAFNPPHMGHRHAVETFKEAHMPDKLIIMPTGTSPHKPLPAYSPSNAQRLELCRAMFGDIAEVSDIEINSNDTNYTIHTVQKLLQQYPGAKITLGIGSDMLLALHQWYKVDKLCQIVEFSALSRCHDDDTTLERQALYMQQTYGAAIHMLKHDAIEISSSTLRVQLRRGDLPQHITPLLPYIDELGLYRTKSEKLSTSEIQRILQTTLSDARYRHCMRTAEFAAELAHCHGLDATEALRAGLWHDLTKEFSHAEQAAVADNFKLPSSCHGQTAACLCFDKYGESREVAHAVAVHVCGEIGMSEFAKCIYIADKCEPGRDYLGVAQWRKLAKIDLNAAFIAIADELTGWRISQSKPAAPKLLAVRNWLMGM